MEKAIQQAQDTFKYFWRELSWEYRRIVPALDLAIVKKAFTQKKLNPFARPLEEYMWLNDIDFDGEFIYATLVNEPNELTNVTQGDRIVFPLTELVDWLMDTDKGVCGGFTIQYFRAQMNNEERKEHDEAWGIDFGDYRDISIVRDQKEHPENFIEHPMSINMKESLQEYLETPVGLTALQPDELGNTLLHKEAIAGNKTSIEVLLAKGANPNLKNKKGKTALDYAKQLQWEQLIPLLG